MQSLKSKERLWTETVIMFLVGHLKGYCANYVTPINPLGYHNCSA